MSVRTTVKSIQDSMRQDVGVDGDAQRLSQLCWMFFLKIIDDQDVELELLNVDYRSPIPEALQWRTWAANPEGITGDALLDFINNTLFPQHPVPAAQSTAHQWPQRQPLSRGARCVRGCLQLLEVRPA